jgi:hypothetical protein
MQGLFDTLKQCVERLDRYRRSSQRVRESNTKAGPIERSSASRSCGSASSSTAKCTALDELFNAGEPSGHLVALVAKLQGGVGSVCLPLVDCHGFELVFD